MVAGALLAALGAACSPARGSETTHSPAVMTTAVTAPVPTGPQRSRPEDPDDLGGAGCQPPTLINVANEVRGTATEGTLYGLVFARLPLRVGQPVKIVWRMTGAADLAVGVRSPDDRTVPLVWGPESHGSSTYIRPGDEWGTGYLFDVPGCWHLHLQRSGASADVWLSVEP